MSATDELLVELVATGKLVLIGYRCNAHDGRHRYEVIPPMSYTDSCPHDEPVYRWAAS